MRAFFVATFAAAMALVAAPASADCSGGHKQVSASVAQPKETKIVIKTNGTALVAGKKQDQTVVAAASCAVGKKDCKAGTE